MASSLLVITRLNEAIERYVGRALAVAFAGLIAVVFMQVAARNVLHMPMIWTLDLAQLLFAWCIFIGPGEIVNEAAECRPDPSHQACP